MNIYTPTLEKTNELIEEFFNSRVQKGSISIVGARYATVFFNTTFLLIPVVILTMRDPTNKVAVVSSATVSGFTVDMGNTTTVDIDWLAIAR